MFPGHSTFVLRGVLIKAAAKFAKENKKNLPSKEEFLGDLEWNLGKLSSLDEAYFNEHFKEHFEE